LIALSYLVGGLLSMIPVRGDQRVELSEESAPEA
jgi:hypothetical protein